MILKVIIVIWKMRISSVEGLGNFRYQSFLQEEKERGVVLFYTLVSLRFV